MSGESKSRKEAQVILAQTIDPLAIPEDTRKLAQKIFRKGNRYLTLRDELGPIFQEADFQALYSSQGLPVYRQCG